MVIRQELTQDYRTLVDQHSEELTLLLEDFGESQEDIFRQVMEITSEYQRKGTIVVPNNDSAQHDEPQPNSNNPLEVTTTLMNATGRHE